MLLRSLRATRRRRTRTFAGLAAGFALSAVAVACGLDAIATKELPDPADVSEGGAEVSLPPKPDGGLPDADAEAGRDGAVSCPTGHGAMVVVDAGGLFFCIDGTEVRNDEYESFVNATDGGRPNALDAAVPDGCATNVTFLRTSPSIDPASFPVARVDWCDAFAYCAWAGKRLCGKHVAHDASTGEWFTACTNGGATKWPYGNAYDASACNDNSSAGTEAVGAASCQGGVPGLYDMNGNVAELVDNCTAGTCSGMGGYFFAPAVPTQGCATATEYTKVETNPGIGFRCCGDPR